MGGRGTRLLGLDALRGFAAIAIAVYHSNALLSLQKWPAYTGYLSMAVQLFFALSAFSLCVGYQNILADKRKVSEYALRRYLRIAPLFYLMMIWALSRIIYNGWNIPDLKLIIINLTFLFPFFPGAHESLVSAGWSLGIEMLFYVLFPFIIAIVTDVRRAILCFVGGIFVQCICGYWLYKLGLTSNFHWMAFPVQLGFFLVGILVYQGYRNVPGAWDRSKLAWGILIAVVALLYIGIASGIFELRFDGWPGMRPAIGYLLATLIFAFAIHPFPIFVNRVTVYLGEISYGVYLIHPQVIKIVGKPSQDLLVGFGLSSGTVSVFVIGAVLATTFLIASLTYHFIERPIVKSVRPRLHRQALTV